MHCRGSIHVGLFPRASFICAALGMVVFLQAVVQAATPVAGTTQGAGPSAGVPRFELDIQPILTVAGCNQGACHGKSRGQNGFALSLLAFDEDFDYASIVKQARGRRVFPAAPDQSLLLRKSAGILPHGGGVRLPVDSEHYRTLRTWIAAGMPRKAPTDPGLVRIELTPASRTMPPRDHAQLSVTAHYSDGSRRDVTNLSAFQSNDPAIAKIAPGGRVDAGAVPGETAIMARYMGNIATFEAAIPYSGGDPPDVASGKSGNFIDELVRKKLRAMGLTPSEPAPDHVFLRRAHLDIIGRLPTMDETRAFLADSSADKRAALVDRLLERPEYADRWANLWADLLRPNPYRVGIKSTLSLDMWLRDAFRRNVPYDQFVRELVTARGSTWHNGATVIFRDRRTPDEITTLVSQLFLGIRLECAKCHHHPFEVWGQDDFYSLSAYFARVGRKGTGVSPPISGSEEMILSVAKGTVTHPTTGAVLEPKPLFGAAPEIAADSDPRDALAAWITSAENLYFARVAVNRVWAELMGVGLVDPVDDLRATNPPSNAALLDALARHFREQKFDLKKLIRSIANSDTYAVSSLPSANNQADNRNYSRHYRKRLRAEMLLDAVSDVTGSPESFEAMPASSRAAQLWTHRIDSLFLDAFGRPDPNQDPPCERTSETTMVQALHLMNAPRLQDKISRSEGFAAQLSASSRSPEQVVEELYLRVYSRLPTPEERVASAALFAEAKDAAARRQLVEDLIWAMLNTPEFVFVD